MTDVTMTTTTGATLLLVLARLAGLFVFAPGLSHPAVPVKVRGFAAVVFALAVTPVVGAAGVPESLAGLAVALLCEGLLGLVIALSAAAVFAGVELGAAHVAHQMGLSLGSIYEPQGEADQTVPGFFHLLALVVFLGLGGHRVVISGLLGTFHSIPLAGFSADATFLQSVTALLGAGFLLALRLAAPVLAAVLLATVAMGLLQKTMPAINTFSVGLSVRSLVGLAVMGAGLAATTPLIERAIVLWHQKLPLLVQPG